MPELLLICSLSRASIRSSVEGSRFAGTSKGSEGGKTTGGVTMLGGGDSGKVMLDVSTGDEAFGVLAFKEAVVALDSLALDSIVRTGRKSRLYRSAGMGFGTRKASAGGRKDFRYPSCFGSGASNLLRIAPETEIVTTKRSRPNTQGIRFE